MNVLVQSISMFVVSIYGGDCWLFQRRMLENQLSGIIFSDLRNDVCNQHIDGGPDPVSNEPCGMNSAW